ncbi:MAG TPA: hypothetical protein ENI70_00145 [Candidatus Peregrinibacteria bacterium]|nr:hypothetical protein [Candidatus Peregrinibacteria bacterium]
MDGPSLREHFPKRLEKLAQKAKEGLVGEALKQAILKIESRYERRVQEARQAAKEKFLGKKFSQEAQKLIAEAEREFVNGLKDLIEKNADEETKKEFASLLSTIPSKVSEITSKTRDQKQ